MKICYFNSDFPPNLGGMASVASNLAEAISRKAEVNKVVVVAFNNENQKTEIKEKMEINALKDKSLLFIFLKTFYYTYKYRDFDFFHATDLFPVGFFLVLIAGKIFRKKVFVSVNGTDALSKSGSRITYKIKKWTLNNCYRIITISKSSKDLIAKNYDLEPVRFTIIAPGLDNDFLVSQPKNIRKDYNISEDDFVVLSVGRLIKRKGFDDLIRTMALIDDASVKLMIVGEGEESENLKKLTKDLKLENRIIFTGKVDSVSDYYYSANLFSMPSKYLENSGDVEGLGLVYLEAQYFGLPVIGTKSGGIPEAMIENKTGFLVEEGDINSLSERIKELKNDSVKYFEFKNEAIQFIKNNFIWSDVSLKMIKEYRRENKIIAILRIKNEIEIIDECLTRLSQLVDEIVVVDNDSNDGTENVYKNYPKVVEVLRTIGFDEGRDKIMLLDSAKKRNPDWIIFLDADEIFEKNFTRKDMERYMSSGYDKINFRFCLFWLSRKRCRLFDKKYFLYSLQPARCMWRNKEETYFKNLIIHNDNIQGTFKKVYFSPYRLKHYTLMDRQKILDKINLYRSVDKEKRDYDHMHPDIKYFTYPFLEFNNHFINYLFVIFIKYLFHALWIPPIIYLRAKKMLKK